MKIIVDADACPVKEIVVNVAKTYRIKVIMVSSINHEITDDYCQIITVDASSDAADHAIVSHMSKGDLIVTQDYGLASLVIAKSGYAINQDGWFYNERNIDALLLRRYLNQKARRLNKRATYHPKRSKDKDEAFEKALKAFLISKQSNKEGRSDD